MPMIMIKCPTTGKAVPTGMSADEKAWKEPTNTWGKNTFNCPGCQQPHTWDKKDGFLAST